MSTSVSCVCIDALRWITQWRIRRFVLMCRSRSAIEKRRGPRQRSFSFKDSAAMRRTFPAAGNRVGGSDAFVSRIANRARQVTTDEDRRLNYGCRFDVVARERTHRPAIILIS